MTQKIFNRVTDWQDKTFPFTNAYSKVIRLRYETKELIDSITEKKGYKETSMEFADCIMLIYGAAHSYGMKYADILKCIENKMDICETREWGSRTKME